LTLLNLARNVVFGKNHTTTPFLLDCGEATMKRKRFGIEALESRAMLAGNITIEQNGDTLSVTGDDLGNDFTLIRDDQGQLVATGFGTTVNGGVAPLAFTGINNIVIDGNGGDDSVFIDHNNIPLNSVQVDLGDGDDAFEINRTSIQSLSIAGGNGDDIIVIGIPFQADITTQAGVDAAVAAGSVGAVSNLLFDGGEGADEFYANRVFGEGNWSIALGEGNDTYATYWTSSGALVLNGGGGDDSISIGYHVSNEATNVQGADGNDLLSVYISNFKRDAAFGGGNGFDTVAIDTNYFERSIVIDTGSDADTFVLAANVIDLNATIVSGGGDDNGRIGRRYDNSLGGNIVREQLYVDTGSGNDTAVFSVNDVRNFFGILGSGNDNATFDYNLIRDYGVLDGGGGFDTVARNGNSNVRYINFEN
jgi:hypothetical protein